MKESIFNAESLNIKEENIQKLKQLFPEAFTEEKVDFEKLRQLLGDSVEQNDERYNFTWNGKRQALQISQTPATGTLRPCLEDSKNWDTTQNLYIEGDNLEVLKLLQKSYYGKVKMIYIDPPYNTGQEFVYPDNFHDSLENYKRITGQVDGEGNRISTNSETSGRYHTDWLNMMYPRLRLARNLLSEDGVIFISIDDHEVHNLRKICDEVFGESNFVAQIIWQKKTGASDATTIATVTEYILVFIKTNLTNDIFSKNTDAYDLMRYKYTDQFKNARGPYYIDNLDRGGLQYSDSLNYGIECPDGTITFPNGRTKYINDGWIWKWSKQKIEWAKENHFLEFRPSSTKASGWAVCYKNYLNVDNENNSIVRAAPHKNIILDILNANAANTMKKLFGTNRYFDYSKPPELIQRLISFVQTNNDDIILDFFSGSATTAHAVMQLNAEDGGKRKFIMVQLPEPTDEKSEAFKAGYPNICEIGKERIRRAGEAILSEHPARLQEKLKELENAGLITNEENLFSQGNEEQASDSSTQILSNTLPSVVNQFLKEKGYQLTSQADNNHPQFSLFTELANQLTLDVGFKVLTLDSSNFRQWQSSVEDLETHIYDNVNNYTVDRSELDVVYEIMLKYGLELTYPIETHSVGNKKFYSIAAGALNICLDNELTIEVANAMLAHIKQLQPESTRVVFKDAGFINDSAKTNTKEIFRQSNVKEFITI